MVSNHQLDSNLRRIEQLFADVYAPKALEAILRNIVVMCARVPDQICCLPPADVLFSYPLTTYFYMEEKELVWCTFLERILDENATRAASVQFLDMHRSRGQTFRRLAPLIADVIRLLHPGQLGCNCVDKVDYYEAI